MTVRVTVFIRVELSEENKGLGSAREAQWKRSEYGVRPSFPSIDVALFSELIPLKTNRRTNISINK